MGYFNPLRQLPLALTLTIVTTNVLVLAQEFQDSDYPWSYKCVVDPYDGPACQREEVDPASTTKIPLNICILNCGQYGGLWPFPKSVQLGTTLSGVNFQRITFGLPSLPQPDEVLLRMINEASDIFKGYLQAKIPEDVSESVTPGSVVININVGSLVKKFTIGTDESYTLSISTTGQVTISATTFFGIRHGLESLSQLIDFNAEQRYFQIVNSVTMQDSPAFAYRGLLIDTGRNFIPLSDLKRLVDGLSYNKLNILHWHITDSNSFPFYTKRVPQMIKYGTYSSKKIYMPEDVSEFLQYANQRGVKVIPELDMPSHAGNGWQYGEKEGLGLLSMCLNFQPYTDYCIQPPCGQLNPLNENVYTVLGELFRDFLDTFDRDIFHMGGDEISYKCWLAYPEINQWLTDHNSTELMDIWGLFQEKALAKLKESTGGSPITAIVWTSEMTNYARQYLNPEDYIIQIWTKATDDITTGIYNEGYRVIFSNNDTVYLDHGYGPWRGNYLNPNAPLKTWQVIYANDILGQVERQVGKAKMEELYADGKLMGGVATLWNEKGDALNMDMKMWPRGSAYAERLWSNPPSRLNVTQMAYPRLINMRERLVQRGIKPDTLLPESCYHIWGFCDVPYF